MGVLHVGMIKKNTTRGCDEFNSLEQICNILDSHDNLDVLLAPEWFCLPKEGLYNFEDFNFIKKTLEEKTRGRDILLIPGTIGWSDGKFYRNTATMISNGKTEFVYSKRFSGGDRGLAWRNNLIWRSGKKKGIFNWKGYRCGVEICADHPNQALLKKDGVKNLDLQFIISYGVRSYNISSAVSYGGYVLKCDGFHKKCEVKRKKFKLKTLKEFEKENIDEDICLITYDLKISDKPVEIQESKFSQLTEKSLGYLSDFFYKFFYY